MTELKIEELLDMIGRRDVPAIKAYFADQNPIDIAELLSEDAELPLAKLYRLLPKTLAAEVFVEMDSDTQAKLIAEPSDKEIAETMSAAQIQGRQRGQHHDHRVCGAET